MADPSIKEALLMTIIRASSEGTLLDSEDQDVILQYHLGNLTRDDLDLHIKSKAGIAERALSIRRN